MNCDIEREAADRTGAMQVRAAEHLGAMRRALRDDAGPARIEAARAVVYALQTIGLLSADQAELWIYRFGVCPGHDDEGGRAWCAYCGDLPAEASEERDRSAGLRVVSVALPTGDRARAQQRIGACLSMPPEIARGPSGAADSWRGHPIARVNAETYVYTDTGAPVRDDPHRPCGACGRPDTPEGHDGCLGTLPDVINACCGHGDTDAAYIQRDDGTVVRGEEALSEVTAARPDQRSDAAEREEAELRAISEAERAEEESER